MFTPTHYTHEAQTDPKTPADQVLLIERYREAGLMTEREYQLKAADLDAQFGIDALHSTRVA